MISLLYPFMALAAVGFALSATAHLMALPGMAIPGGGAVWTLRVGVFVVWIPTVLLGQKIVQDQPPREFWRIALTGCPPWMRNAVYGLFAYAFINFAWFLSYTLGHAPS